MEDKTVMLVELDYPYPEGNGYILYSVPEGMEEKAKEAIQIGFQKYEESNVPDLRTICDFIEAEFKASGIQALCLSYEVVSLEY